MCDCKITTISYQFNNDDRTESFGMFLKLIQGPDEGLAQDFWPELYTRNNKTIFSPKCQTITLII